MKRLNSDDVQEYVNANTVDHNRHWEKLFREITLQGLLNQNPYLLVTRNITVVQYLIEGLLEALLLSSEEKLLSDFLEGLAVFIAGRTCGGRKSTAQGVDLEFINRGTHYVVSIKSGPNWGNSSQHRKLAQDLKNAEIRVKQSRTALKVQPVLGICYGKTRTNYMKAGYLKVVGQNFWYLISEDKGLYTDIIEPIGYRAKERNEAFDAERAKVINRFTKEFIDQFCDASGVINWGKLVEFNSGNYDLDVFL
jgi:hypothetical protein